MEKDGNAYRGLRDASTIRVQVRLQAGQSRSIRSNSVALIVKVQGATGIQPVDISMGMRDSNQARRANTFIMRDLQGIELVLVRRRGRDRRSKQAQTPAHKPHAPFNSIWLGDRDSNSTSVHFQVGDGARLLALNLII